MEPFTSNDTYACPDCGSEVRVGARSCPGCGPFRPMEWSEEEPQPPNEPATPFHSQTTYTDNREVLEKSRRPVKSPLKLPPEPAPQNFQAIFISILVVLTLLAVAMAALKMLRF